MQNLSEIVELFQCPVCHKKKFTISKTIKCESCNTEYPISHMRPVLLKPSNDIFKFSDYVAAPPPPKITQNNSSNFIPTPSVNLSQKKVLAHLKEFLKVLDKPKILVIGGGVQKQILDDCFGVIENSELQLIYSDIDINAVVDIFCDAHDLPFKANVFDAVITTAVLEHVLYPEIVASEIYRVLKIDGLLYSELPFMQQVHEGAYDFTRYTLSGHRRLFNGFSTIDSGMVAGPGTALVWAIENFFLAFTTKSLPRKITKFVVRLSFFWIKYFDYLLVKRPAAMDGASCTYFFGQKKSKKTPDSEIISNYVGAKHMSHT